MAARKHIVPIFLPQWGCPYQCVYCDQTVIAAREGALEITGQINEALEKVPPGAYPVEVAFYGGTFTALPLKVQEMLLAQVQGFIRGGRVNSIRLSTHPACLGLESLALLADMGVTTVELGVQSMDREVLANSGRDYGPETVVAGVDLLRRFNFQVGIQLMPGLPGDTKQKTLETVKSVIKLAPDFVRVYPTVVIANTALAELWQKGKYKALSVEEAIDWCKEISKQLAAAHIPIIRMGLHPSNELEEQVLAGPYHPAFKALVDSALALEKVEAQIKVAGDELVIYCNPKNISTVRGDKNCNIVKLKEKYGFDRVRVLPKADSAIDTIIVFKQ